MTRNDLDINAFERELRSQKANIEKSIAAIRLETNLLALEDEIDDIGDMAELQIENMTDQKILRHLESEKAEIDDALMRIKKGMYGLCETTGLKIPIERLRVNPIARTII